MTVTKCIFSTRLLRTYEALNVASKLFGKYTICEFNISTFVQPRKA